MFFLFLHKGRKVYSDYSEIIFKASRYYLLFFLLSGIQKLYREKELLFPDVGIEVFSEKWRGVYPMLCYEMGFIRNDMKWS